MKKIVGWLLVCWTAALIVVDVAKILGGSDVSPGEPSWMILWHDVYFLLAVSVLFAYAFDLFERRRPVSINSQPYDTLVERLFRALKESSFRERHSNRDWAQALWHLFGPFWRLLKGAPQSWECPRCAEDLTETPDSHIVWTGGGIQPGTPDGPEMHWGEGLKCCTRCGEIFEFEDSSC